MAIAGHVFVVTGDIRTLACDAWILPTDRTQNLTETWRRGWSRGFALPPLPPVPEGWEVGSIRAWPGWPADRAPPWLVALAGPQSDSAGPARRADRWLDEIAAALRPTPPRHGRCKHLIALPVLSTGLGGHHRVAGEVIVH